MNRSRITRALVLCAGLALTAGCAHRTKVLDAPAVSMTRTTLVPGESIRETGPVSGKFCADSMSDKGTIGLIDESVKAAQSAGQVDYVLNASFWRSASCMEVEGTGGKVVASTPGSTPGSPSARPTGRSEKR